MIRTTATRPLMRTAWHARCGHAPALLAAAALFTAPAAWAGITPNPASIVDHGSYISDTVNQRDWYKFSNAATTVGLSYDEALAQFAPLGWSTANLAQVQGLQAQFGWLADTPSPGQNANFGLTRAMDSFLGYTYVFFITNGNGETKQAGIEALTSEAFFANGNAAVQYQVTTSSDIVVTDLHKQVFFTGDFVLGDFALQTAGIKNDFRGVWLSRDSTPPVPEPGTWALFGLGIGLTGLYMRRRQRA